VNLSKEPHFARLHFIPRAMRRPQNALVRAMRGYFSRAPGWVLLTTIGRRTGAPRETLLPCARTESEIIVISTYGWRSDWIRNLRSNPSVRVTRDGTVVPGRAEIVEDAASKRAVVTAHPFVPLAPFRIVHTLALDVFAPVTTGILRRWVIARAIVVTHV
jgi:deazaflavin-dependent oxidoreductase (nitroreductase family)